MRHSALKSILRVCLFGFFIASCSEEQSSACTTKTLNQASASTLNSHTTSFGLLKSAPIQPPTLEEWNAFLEQLPQDWKWKFDCSAEVTHVIPEGVEKVAGKFAYFLKPQPFSLSLIENAWFVVEYADATKSKYKVKVSPVCWKCETYPKKEFLVDLPTPGSQIACKSGTGEVALYGVSLSPYTEPKKETCP
jgi:hypothetical protein